MDDRSIKNNIYRIRKKYSISQEDLAKKIGLQRNAYREIENGKTKMLGGHVEEIAQALGVPVEEIVVGYVPASREKTEELKEITQRYETRIKEASDSAQAKIQELTDKLEKAYESLDLAKDNIKMKDESIDRLKKENQQLREKLTNFATGQEKDDAKGDQSKELSERESY